MEVVMKTRLLKTTVLTLAVLSLAACSSSLQVSSTSSWDDEIYGNGSSKKELTAKVERMQANAPTEKSLDYQKMDQKFSDALKVLEDSSKSDTVIYKAEETNPYRKILSDSYQESYERRLRGFEDPRYGLENWTTYYSDDFWYASAYDPSYYRVVVMGGQVWVEPWYIYNSFGWPRTSFYLGLGFGWGYSPWYSSFYYSPWHYYPYSYWNSTTAYWWGWNDASYYWNKPYNSISNYYYGPRGNSITRTDAYIGNRVSPTQVSGAASNTRRSTSATTNTDKNNPITTTRATQTRVTPVYENTRRTNQRTSSSSGEQIRITRPSRTIGITEPTRRGTSVYDRTRTSTGNSFNSTRRISRPSTTSTRRTGTSPVYTQPTRSSIYNRPSRVSTPSTNSSSRRSSSSTYSPSRSSSSSSSYSSGSRSNSTRSSYSGSSRSSSSSSSSSNTRRH
jgi:hypothetical protein